MDHDLIHGNWLKHYQAYFDALISAPPEPVVLNQDDGLNVLRQYREFIAERESVPRPPVIQKVFIDNECYAERFCPVCTVNFARAGDLDRHLFEIHPEYFRSTQHGAGITAEGPLINFTRTQQALNEQYVIYKANLANLVHFKDVEALFVSCRESATNILREELERRRSLRAIFSIQPIFSRTNPGTGEVETTEGARVPTMTSFTHILMDRSMIPRTLESAMNKIAIEVEEFIEHGSGWVLSYIKDFTIKMSTFEPIQGSSYIELPSLLQRKKYTLLNIKNDVINEDQDHLKCFVWSVLAHTNLAGVPEGQEYRVRRRSVKNVSVYKPHLGKLNLKGLTFPMTIEQIPKFERLNPTIGITVIAYELDGHLEDEITEDDSDTETLGLERRRKNASYDKMQENIRKRCYPRYICKEQRPILIDLLLLVAEAVEGEPRPDHFVLIKNLVSLLHTKHNSKVKDICRNCLQLFQTTQTCNQHKKYCAALRLQKTTFPNEWNNFLRFSKWERTQKLPFVIYADFESLLLNVVKDEAESSKTIKEQEHKVCGYSWICVDHFGNRVRSNRHRAISNNESVAKTFLAEIIDLCKDLRKIMCDYQRIAKDTMVIDDEQQQHLNNQAMLGNELCCFCEKRFNSQDPPNHHHSHLPPYNFIGLAHGSSCNLQASMSDIIPVIFHNLSAYDGHFIIQACDKDLVETMNIIPKTSEKFLSILFNGYIRFIDSFAFFPQSLAQLVGSLPIDSFNITRQQFGKENSEETAIEIYNDMFFISNDEERFKTYIQILNRRTVAYPSENGKVEMLLKKQAYPYSYMDSLECFREKKLPPPEAFYNDLKDEPIEPSVYKHLGKVWKDFGLKNLGDLHDLHCALDTSLLADVFETNRRTMLKHYGLDLAHYLSLPMITKDCLLKKTKARLELFTDSTMYVWIEGGIRGGLVSVGSLRSAKANNLYMGSEYDPALPTSYITFLDINNQYGFSLSEALPEKDFKWVENLELDRIIQESEDFIMNLGIDDSTGYIFEVSLEVPENLHDYLNDYPPCPVRREVRRENLSSYQKNLMDELDCYSLTLKTERLIADLFPKKNLVCHYRNLQMWLNLGCKLLAIHKVLKFTQSRWMKEFIDFNTSMRQLATSEIEIAFWKALNNCGFGKMIEKLRDRMNIIPIMTETKGKQYNKKPTVQHFKIINEGLVLMVMKHLAVTLNNPIIVGLTCFELAKLLNFNFHYGYMKKKYGTSARLCYSDTDSLAYYIETPLDIYQEFKNDEEEWFDMSDYDKEDPIWSKFYSPLNKKVLGKLKDEFANSICTHIVIPKPKMYIVRSIQSGIDKISGTSLKKISEKKKAKGIPKNVVKKSLRQEHYVNALLGHENEDVCMRTIRSFNHVLYTINSSKKSISGLDVKRFCLADSVNTLAYGHKDIPLFEL